MAFMTTALPLAHTAALEHRQLAEPDQRRFQGALDRGKWRIYLARALAMAMPLAAGGAMLAAAAPAVLLATAVGMLAASAITHKSGQLASSRALRKLGLSRAEAKRVNKPLDLYQGYNVSGANWPSIPTGWLHPRQRQDMELQRKIALSPTRREDRTTALNAVLAERGIGPVPAVPGRTARGGRRNR